ncbi:MAG: FtsK/SpoIIIE domain-containing protein [Jatrophihabitantaceae bacterium]
MYAKATPVDQAELWYRRRRRAEIARTAWRWLGRGHAVWAVPVFLIILGLFTVHGLIVVGWLALPVLAFVFWWRRREAHRRFEARVAAAGGPDGYALVQRLRSAWLDLCLRTNLAVEKPIVAGVGTRAAFLGAVDQKANRLTTTADGSFDPDAYDWPSVVTWDRTSAGWSIIVQMVPPTTIDDYAAVAPVFAAVLGAPLGVRVSAVPGRPELVELLLADCDPLQHGFDLDAFRAVLGRAEFPRLRLAVDEAGRPVDLPPSHILVVGASGSGKGSCIQTILDSWRPAWEQGLVKLYGIDPKRSELKSLGGGLFESVAYDRDETVELLESVVDFLKERQRQSGRSFAVSPDNPYLILVIDEFNSLLTDSDPKRKRAVADALNTLLSQGRSDGCYVVAAAQQPQKEALGPYRPHFMLRVALRTESPVETDLVLGDGAVEAGAAAHMIAPATEGNAYATAGIGFVRGETDAAARRVRFPFVADKVVASWDEAARAAREAAVPSVMSLEALFAEEGEAR